jgi:uncharacterized repeat protein (TIGR01451 family)
VTRQHRTIAFLLLALSAAGLALFSGVSGVTPAALAVIGPCTPTFTQPSGPRVSVGSNPSSVTVGRFNADGYDDLAVTNTDSNDVTILLGNGSGGFTPASGSPVSAGTYPYSATVGRFNGDAFDDLAVANVSSNDVTILLGDGNGGFAPAAGSPISVGSLPSPIIVGRFNADAYDDLGVANFGSNSVSILLGDGSGGFTSAVGSPVSVGTNPWSVTVGRFNSDGINDLAVANDGASSVSILLGDGNGGFTPAVSSPISVGLGPSSVVTGRFNTDALDDLAVVNNGHSNVSILLGDGNGGFISAGAPVTVGTLPLAAKVGRFNGDAFDDLAVANNGSSNVTILLGDGAGGFNPAGVSPVTVGVTPYLLAVGNFNGDAVPDLAVPIMSTHDLTLLLTTCTLANLGVSGLSAPEPLLPGSNLTYTLSVQNLGPDAATTVSLTDPLPAGTTFVSLSPPGGWSCITPSVGSAGTVSCSIASLPMTTANFTLVVQVGPGVAAPSTLTNVVSVTAATGDGVGGNNSTMVQTNVVAPTPTATPIATVTPTPTLTLTPVPVTCAPRPVVGVDVIAAGADRLKVTLSPGNGSATPGYRLTQLRATIPPNARIDVAGGPSNLSGQQLLPVGSGTQPVEFFVRRVSPGAVTVPLVVTDTCGDWSTFVGGGASSF